MNTGEIPAFKLMYCRRYWRGREEQCCARLRRALETQEELEAYEADRGGPALRYHRRIGRDLKLFDLIDEVVRPRRRLPGATIRRELQRWIEDLEIEHGPARHHTGSGQARALRQIRPLGPLPRCHVPGDGARGGVRPASDELPKPRHGVHERPALLPRAAHPHRELGNMHRWEKSVSSRV